VQADRARRIAGLLGTFLALGACEAELPAPALPSTDPELRAELGIDDEVPIHRIDLTGDEGEIRIVPRETAVRSGDVVQLVTLDHRVYLVAFDAAELGEGEWDFLRVTGQDSPAPLVARGSRLVFTFDEAPPGTYSFEVESSGAAASGVIRVE
jgi:hypothetical protein